LSFFIWAHHSLMLVTACSAHIRLASPYCAVDVLLGRLYQRDAILGRLYSLRWFPLVTFSAGHNIKTPRLGVFTRTVRLRLIPLRPLAQKLYFEEIFTYERNKIVSADFALYYFPQVLCQRNCYVQFFGEI